MKHSILILEPKHFTTTVYVLPKRAHFTTTVNTATQPMFGISVTNIAFIVSAFDINERGMFGLINGPTDFLILAHTSNIKTMMDPVKLVHWSQSNYLVFAAI